MLYLYRHQLQLYIPWKYSMLKPEQCRSRNLYDYDYISLYNYRKYLQDPIFDLYIGSEIYCILCLQY